MISRSESNQWISRLIRNLPFRWWIVEYKLNSNTKQIVNNHEMNSFLSLFYDVLLMYIWTLVTMWALGINYPFTLKIKYTIFQTDRATFTYIDCLNPPIDV